MVQKYPEAMQTTGVIQHPADSDNPSSEGAEDTVPLIDPVDCSDEYRDMLDGVDCWDDWNNIEETAINQLHVVAPGEGKTPVNHTFTEDWDAKAFPMLHPDGLNHLSDKRRKKKLGELEFFKQRLFILTPAGVTNPCGYLQQQFIVRRRTLSVTLTLAIKRARGRRTAAGMHSTA